jgi:hypothetical protein
MRWIDRIGIVAVILLSAAGCHSSGSTGPDQPAGAGGRTGLDGSADLAGDRAGTDGSDARTGAQDTDGGSGLGACLGVCLETFFAQCQKVGQGCMTATTSSGQVNNCYDNGVKQAEIQSSSGTTLVVQTPAGHTCYESDLAATIETIKDLDDKMIAQITHVSPTQLTVDCYGADGSVATTHADLSTPACAGYYASTTQTCTAGSCTFQ